MDSTSPRAFLLSATVHLLVVIAFFLSYVSNSDEPAQKILELVAGEGDNFMATEAPALGSESGVKLPTPKPPEPQPAPVQTVTQAPVAPPTPAPVPVPPTAPSAADSDIPNFKKQIQRKIIVADSKAKLEIKKERAAEKKREDEEKKRISKEEFDQKNKAKSSTPTKVASNTKAPKVDAEGIAKGVVGGSPNNKTGGAGGKALKSDNTDVLAAYDALFKTKLRAAFESPPGLSDSLKATIEFRSNADGAITSVRVAQSSGSAEFDRAVLEAVARVKMPPRPDKKAETLSFVFSMRERE